MTASFFRRPHAAAALCIFVAFSLPTAAGDKPDTAAIAGQDITAETPEADTIGPPPEDPQQYEAWAKKFLDSLHERTGTITLGDKLATIKTGDDYYYLPPEDEKKVLETAWGNPPGGKGLGMLFPKRYTPLDQDSWAVDIHYEETGHINDDNAADINYDDLLDQMKKDTAEESEERVRQGYGAIELIGWASPPYYDVMAKKLHWAEEFSFNHSDKHTLNYKVRVLGRKGVLVLNFIADMSQLGEIQKHVGEVLDNTNFEPGSLFSDFNPSIDKTAAIGIGGLIAGKVLAKTGLLAVLLLGLKKIGLVLLAFKKVVIVAFLGAISFVKRLFGKKDEAEAGETAAAGETVPDGSAPAPDTAATAAPGPDTAAPPEGGATKDKTD